jgi:hypothetical protein
VGIGQSSTERVFLSGQEVAVQGVTMGADLFRDPAASGLPLSGG